MSIGLLALLDDVAGLVKVAAASLDDIAGQATKAGVKAAGAVIDDAAVTPRYVDGFTADRELPIVGKIALGSIKNKLLYLLPAALLLSVLAPWAITPLLMIGGAYLCYEGAEKVFEPLLPHDTHGEAAEALPGIDAVGLEDAKVSSAIQTDFILSAEIMTIALAAIPAGDFVTQALVLGLVGVGITLLVYGGVALIVKADDFGLFMAKRARTGAGRAFGRGLVVGMPVFMQILGVIGTAAMIWVGGGIVIHGLVSFGFAAPEHLLEAAEAAVAQALPSIADFAGWGVGALLSGIAGIVLGALLIPVAQYAIEPAWKAIKSVLPQGA
ncbi:MAG TPA: DUF808 domain-containing protein [Devosia sp.]|nr:DUF808 domain-containing protein [Devosia sp.]